MSNIDQKINELFEIVRQRKVEVEEAEKTIKQSWKTNCSIVLMNEGTPINIQTAKQETVEKIVMSLLMHRDYAKAAADVLGIKQNDKYLGYTYEDWISDCKKRIATIEIRDKKSELANLEKRLDVIVSPEQKRQMEVEAIANSLKM